MKNVEKIIKNIIKDCYWDYNVTVNDIIDILEKDNLRLKQKLFSKIIHNSSDKLIALQIFSNKEYKFLFENLNIDFYKHSYLKKNILVLRNIFLNENNEIKELKWKKL